MPASDSATSAEAPATAAPLEATLPPVISPRAAVALLLLAFVALCAHGLVWDSVTVDEFAHLPAGYRALRTGRFDLFPLNPPLVRAIAALPLLAMRPQLAPTARIVNTGWYPWVYGTDFMERNRAAYRLLFLLGRLPIVALGALLGLVVHRWARSLYGEGAALVALAFYVFCPTIVAHAHLATVDVGLALFFTLALWLWDRAVERRRWRDFVLCGVALGAAEASKLTALLLYPLLAALAVVEIARGAALIRSTERAGGVSRRVTRGVAALGLTFAVSLAVLAGTYLGRGLGAPLAEQRFASHAMRTLAAPLPLWLPMPFPADYLRGLDSLQLIQERGEFPGYLLGHWSTSGWAGYYLVALLFKTPLPLVGALLAAPFCGRRLAPRREIRVWLPALALLLAMSLASHRVEYGVRYVLPIVPLLIVYASRLWPWAAARGRGARRAVVAGVVVYALSVLLATPNTIDYFNLLAGGRGDRILLDSNIDWGQGLRRVAEYQRRAGVPRIGLAYFGHVDPALYDVTWRFPARDQHGALVAASVNFLHGYDYVTYYRGRAVAVPRDTFTWIASQQEVADLGGGIRVYRVR